MPRPPVWPPKIYHHKASGRARVRWQGRDFWLGPFGSDEARSRYRILLDEIERNGSPLTRAAGITIRELVAWWVEWAPRNYRPTSREPKEFGPAVDLLSNLHGDEPAAKYGPKQLKTLRAELGRRYCRNVANRHLVRIKTLFKRAGEEELIPAGVHHGLLVVRAIPPGAANVVETEPVAAASDDDLARVLPLCPAPVAALLEVSRLTGMRPGEARLMMADQVDRRADGTAVYRRDPKDGHKTAYLGRTRTVILGVRAVRIIAPWLHAAKADGGYVFRPQDSPRSKGRNRGDFYTDNTLPQAVRRAAIAAGVELTPYQLRHAFKLAAVAAGGVGAAMESLGQSSSQAFDRYGRGSLEAAEQLAKKIG